MPYYKSGDILFEKYKIIKFLGTGTAEVYLAENLKVPGSRWALKVLHKGMPGKGEDDFKDLGARFAKEAALGDKLKSAYVIQIIDRLDDKDQQVLVMEYGAGGSLREKLSREKQISVQETLRIGIDLALGLDALAPQDDAIESVHRDLTPNNILLDEHGNAKICDLGLVQDELEKTSRKASSQPPPHPGNPSYMSPEQRESGQFLTPASDIYTLGLVLFEMLSGKHYKEVSSGKKLKNFCPEIPDRLTNLIARMLDREAKNRPQHGAEIAAELQKCRDGGPKPPFWIVGVALIGVLIWAAIRFSPPPVPDGAPAMATATQTATAIATKTITQTPTKTATQAITKTSTATRKTTATVKVEPTLGIGSTNISEIDGMEMVFVPAGAFTMGNSDGDADEKPVHEVYLDGYWIDKYEVTNAQYTRCVADDGCGKPKSTEYYSDSQYADHPVVYIYWYDAQNYCDWAGRRFPSEAEWEKAARGTDGRTYPWGNKSPNTSLLNYDGNEGGTKPVGSYLAGASPYGALDMAGNVWEWTADWYDEDYYSKSSSENPSGPSSGEYRVLRGGAWFENIGGSRLAFRGRGLPYGSSNNFVGFRCAISASP